MQLFREKKSSFYICNFVNNIFKRIAISQIICNAALHAEAVVMEIFNLRHLEWFQLARTDLDKPRLSAAQRLHGGEKIKISKTI